MRKFFDDKSNFCQRTVRFQHKNEIITNVQQVSAELSILTNNLCVSMWGQDKIRGTSG